MYRFGRLLPHIDVSGVGERNGGLFGRRRDPIAYNSVTLHLNIEHTAVGDLVVRLNPPTGRPIDISDKVGGDTDNLVLTGIALNTDREGRANGNRTLTIHDSKRRTIGRLVSWALEFEE